MPAATPNTVPDADPDADPDAEPDAESDAESDAEPNVDPNAEPDAEPDAEPNAPPPGLLFAPLPKRSHSRGQRPANLLLKEYVTSNNGKFVCKCKRKSWKHWNATRIRQHLEICESLTETQRQCVAESSTAAKKQKVFHALINSESMSISSSIRHVNSNTSNTPSMPDNQTVIDINKNKGSMKKFVHTMTKGRADTILKAEVEACLSRFEPPSRLCDPMVQRSLLIEHPAIGKFLPSDPRTIDDRYVMPIWKEQQDMVKELFAATPGLACIGGDGATVQGSYKIIWTISKGEHHAFIGLNSQREKAHATDAEIAATESRLKEAIQEYGETSSIFTTRKVCGT